MKVLLHACCAPCAAQIIKELQKMGHEICVYFYNPNIFPKEEYDLRFNELKRYTEDLQIPLIEGRYDHKDWLEKVKGLENEPEGGRRCYQCFLHNLGEVAQKAYEEGFKALATTLTISPHKPVEMINSIGQKSADFYGLKFIDQVWRKNNGYKNSCDLSRKYNFHRQNYCGCEFSIKDKNQ
ncbi:MAG TPA: epoxyqueuosine reductase QueH [Patescibacteria group bacterium]|nr:epoxyqueuosine reductase QueH [Patescibacteria group bacterium]